MAIPDTHENRRAVLLGALDALSAALTQFGLRQLIVLITVRTEGGGSTVVGVAETVGSSPSDLDTLCTDVEKAVVDCLDKAPGLIKVPNGQMTS